MPGSIKIPADLHGIPLSVVCKEPPRVTLILEKMLQLSENAVPAVKLLGGASLNCNDPFEENR